MSINHPKTSLTRLVRIRANEIKLNLNSVSNAKKWKIEFRNIGVKLSDCSSRLLKSIIVTTKLKFNEKNYLISTLKLEL